MNHCLLKKICFLLIASTSFVAFADEASELLDLVPATEAVFIDQTIQPVAEEEDSTSAHVAMVELQCLYDLLSKKKHVEGTSSKTSKRVARGAGAATATTIVAALMNIFKKDDINTFGVSDWLIRGLILGGVCVGTYEATGPLLPENIAVYRSVLTHIVNHWNLFQMLIPEEYVPVIQPLYDAFVANNNQLPLSELEAKKFVRTMKYDVKRKMRAHA